MKVLKQKLSTLSVFLTGCGLAGLPQKNLKWHIKTLVPHLSKLGASVRFWLPSWIITDHVDCGLKLFVPHVFFLCFQQQHGALKGRLLL